MRFPHRTRDIGSVPLDGHGGVGWEPELTPHNNCLAVAVPPVTQSNSESDSEEKWKGTGHRRSESEDGKSPEEKPYLVTRGYKNTHRKKHCMFTVYGDKQEGTYSIKHRLMYLLGLGLADRVRNWLFLFLNSTFGKQIHKFFKVHTWFRDCLPHQRASGPKDTKKRGIIYSE